MRYRVTLRASKAGSIGIKYCEQRIYLVDAASVEEAQSKARMMAYSESLEHTLVTSVREGG